MPKKDKKLKKKHKHKEKKKKSKRKHHSSSSDSESDSSAASSGYEWVEEKPVQRSREKSPEHENWLSGSVLSRTYSLKDERKDRKQNSEKNDCIVAEPGQSGRELNPYWKDGGTGLPEENKDSDSETGAHQDAEWLKKALKRAKEQSKNENIPLETVVAERYGSLDNLYKLIDRAEARSRATKPYHRNRHHRPESSHSRGFMKPSEDDEAPAHFSYDGSHRKGSAHFSYDSSHRKGSQGFRKPKPAENIEKVERMCEKSRELPEKNSNTKPAEVLLSDQEMNSLASKILKAEIMGNTALVKELNDKLARAKKVREEAKTDEKDKCVILTTTNARGFTQPVRGTSERHEKKKRKTYDTHVAGERVRYFEDDDKYSLNEMYEKEMTESVSDQNAEFLRLASKSKGDKDYAIDDLFMEQTTSNRAEKEKGLSGAINKQKKAEKALDHCTWCLINNKLQKHLIISTATKSYLSIPFFQSLTEGHCLIAPMYHATCSTLVDEDVWEEMLKYCKHLVQLFRAQDQDVVFFETAFHFKNYPHMLLHCVPIPYESGELLPIYFKKAIMECEKEWAQNKQVVNVSKFDVKRVIPKGLPYFMAHFGMDNGFAHVIEDENRFPRNFAQEVIGGILDLDHRIWRKQQADDFETQCKKVNNFKQFWKEIESCEYD